MDAALQIIGSLIVLVPFVLVQLRKLAPTHPAYLVANAFGSGVLAVEAVRGQQWGFLLLEGVWAIVSVVGLVQVVRAKHRASAHPALRGRRDLARPGGRR